MGIKKGAAKLNTHYGVIAGSVKPHCGAAVSISVIDGSFVRSADLHPTKMLRHGRMAGLVKLHRNALK
ncbi:hypothetical protein OO012_04255 [Rhodobacteraceae bacterium KMM 6894]|nr:hypothetical protein [Rhodobacteraceae bacterium KMM 6894]